MTTLSSLIVEREVATMRQVEEALARQVLYGGDLATNLLELATVSEGALTFMLAETFGIEPAPVGELPSPGEATLRLVPGDMALRHGLYPLGEREGVLAVAVSEPLPTSVEEDLGFALGLPLAQHAAPIVRIRQAIARDYGLPLDRRYLRLVAKLERRPDPSPSSLPPPLERPPEMARLPRPASVPPPAMASRARTIQGVAPEEPAKADAAPTMHVGPSVVAEIERELADGAERTMLAGADEIARLERELSGSPAGVTKRRTLAGLAAQDATRAPVFGAEAPTKRGLGITPMPAPSKAVPPKLEAPPPPPPKEVAPPPPDFVMEAAAATAAEVERKRKLRAAKRAGGALAGWARGALGAKAEERAPERRRGPLTASGAETALEHASTRDEVLSVLFDFARQYFEFTAMFVVHGDLAAGHDSYGPGVDREHITGIGVPLDLPSSLADARERKVPVVQRLRKEGLDAALADDLKRRGGAAVLVLPIVVRARTVALIYGDHGAQPVDLAQVGDVIALVPLVGRAIERLIVKKKLAAFRGATPEEKAVGSTRLSQPPAARPEPQAPRKDARPAIAPDLGFVVAKRPLQVDAELVDEGWSSVPEPAQAASPPSARTQLSADALRHVGDGHEPLKPVLRRDRAVSDLPPPPENLVRRRPLSQRPIPREEPVEDAPVVEVGEALDDATLHAILLEEERSEPASGPPGQIVRELEVATAPASTAIAVSARPPPTARRVGTLPPVVIHSDLVDRVMNGGEDAERALGDILQVGEGAIPAVFAKFPGPLTVDPSAVGGAMPPAADCGPVLRIVAAMRRLALPFLAVRSADADPDVRFWASYLLGELHYPDSATALLPRLFDESTTVRRAALRAARQLVASGDDGTPIRDGLDRIVSTESEPEHRKLLAIDAIGQLALYRAVPALVGVLGEKSEAVVRAARRELTQLTGRDFGKDRARWDEWWRAEGSLR